MSILNIFDLLMPSKHCVLPHLTVVNQTVVVVVDAYLSEVESSRTSLASRTSSRTHFEVLGLGLENFCEDLFFFFWRAVALVSLVLGLEHSCPWPRECLSSERLSLALASDFFCVLGLGLEPCVLDSTSDIYLPVTGQR